MKRGDLVKWKGTPDYTATRPDTGIVVDGPRAGSDGRGAMTAIAYAVAWFDTKTTFWCNEHNLEVISENR
jgi:hypothetical protein